MSASLWSLTLLSLNSFTAIFAFKGYVENPPAGSMKLDPKRIICPVLAAMYNEGDLHPDANGSVTLEQLYVAFTDVMGTREMLATFLAEMAAGYDADNKDTQMHRSRCLPGTACWFKKKIDGKVTRKTERWLNIFELNGAEAAEHGFSTGARGGETNVIDFDTCNGTYPCEARFQQYFVSCADKKQRFYRENIECILCKAMVTGDRGGEFSFNPQQDLRQFQATAAFLGWLSAFGRSDPDQMHNGEPAYYFTMADVRAMVIDGRYPEGWKKRDWGDFSKFRNATLDKLPCHDNAGSYPPWWQGTTCESLTGLSCNTFFGRCPTGATCVSGQCVCGRGSNGISMCARKGRCEERPDTCTYFGEPCKRTLADGPHAPWLTVV